jgi:hypothetical protein
MKNSESVLQTMNQLSVTEKKKAPRDEELFIIRIQIFSCGD